MHIGDKAHVITFLTIILVISQKSLMLDRHCNVDFWTLSFETTYNNTTVQLDTAYFHINANACTVSETWIYNIFWRRIFHAVNKRLHSHSLAVAAWPLSTTVWPWGEKWVWNPCADGNSRRRQSERVKPVWRVSSLRSGLCGHGCLF